MNPPMFMNQEKGGLGKGVPVESSVTAKETKSTQGFWAQQYIWRLECHSQERHTFLQNKTLLKASDMFRSQKGVRKPKNRTKSTKDCSEHFEGVSRSLPSKTRVLRQIVLESSPERSARTPCHTVSLRYDLCSQHLVSARSKVFQEDHCQRWVFHDLGWEEVGTTGGTEHCGEHGDGTFLDFALSLSLSQNMCSCASHERMNIRAHPRHTILGWSQTSGKRMSGTTRPSLGHEVFARFSFVLHANSQEQKTPQREHFRAGYRADVPGAFTRTSLVKNFGQALETLEKQAFGCGRNWPKPADVHDPRRCKKHSARKLRADSFVP